MIWRQPYQFVTTSTLQLTTIILYHDQRRGRVIVVIIMSGYLYRIKVSVYMQVYIQVKTAISICHVVGSEKIQYISKTIKQ